MGEYQDAISFRRCAEGPSDPADLLHGKAVPLLFLRIEAVQEKHPESALGAVRIKPGRFPLQIQPGAFLPGDPAGIPAEVVSVVVPDAAPYRFGDRFQLRKDPLGDAAGILFRKQSVRKIPQVDQSVRMQPFSGHAKGSHGVRPDAAASVMGVGKKQQTQIPFPPGRPDAPDKVAAAGLHPFRGRSVRRQRLLDGKAVAAPFSALRRLDGDADKPVLSKPALSRRPFPVRQLSAVRAPVRLRLIAIGMDQLRRYLRPIEEHPDADPLGRGPDPAVFPHGDRKQVHGAFRVVHDQTGLWIRIPSEFQ